MVKIAKNTYFLPATYLVRFNLKVCVSTESMFEEPKRLHQMISVNRIVEKLYQKFLKT